MNARSSWTIKAGSSHWWQKLWYGKIYSEGGSAPEHISTWGRNCCSVCTHTSIRSLESSLRLAFDRQDLFIRMNLITFKTVDCLTSVITIWYKSRYNIGRKRPWTLRPIKLEVHHSHLQQTINTWRSQIMTTTTTIIYYSPNQGYYSQAVELPPTYLPVHITWNSHGMSHSISSSKQANRTLRAASFYSLHNTDMFPVGERDI